MAETEAPTRLPPSIPLVVDQEFQCLIPSLSDEELAQLEASLVADGCRDAIVVWERHDGCVVLDGHNRLAICQKHHITYTVFTQPGIKTRDDAKLFIIDNQCGRRNLNTYQRTRLALQKKDIIAAKARAKQRAGGARKVCQKSDKAPIDTKREVAKAAGISHDTVYKVSVILENGDTRTKERCERGETSIHDAYQHVRRLETEQRREARRQENYRLVDAAPTFDEAIATARFTTIVADPPWHYESDNLYGRGRPPYATMSIDDIKALPISKKADEDSHLYLWCTKRSLRDGFDVLAARGFEYRDCLIWRKPTFGMGMYFRSQHEYVLFGVRGSQPLKRKDVGTVHDWPRGNGGYSSKPDEFYKLVESCSPGPYLDVFARKPRGGWVTWGAECKVAV